MYATYAYSTIELTTLIFTCPIATRTTNSWILYQTNPTMAKSLHCHFVIASTLDTKASIPKITPAVQKDNEVFSEI